MSHKRINWVAFCRDLEAITGHGDIDTTVAKQVHRDIVRHHTLAERFCNGFMAYNGTEDQAARARGESRLAGVERRLAAFFGPALAEFQGDPRGQTVKLRPYTGIRKLTYFDHDWGRNLVMVGG